MKRYRQIGKKKNTHTGQDTQTDIKKRYRQKRKYKLKQPDRKRETDKNPQHPSCAIQTPGHIKCHITSRRETLTKPRSTLTPRSLVLGLRRCLFTRTRLQPGSYNSATLAHRFGKTALSVSERNPDLQVGSACQAK